MRWTDVLILAVVVLAIGLAANVCLAQDPPEIEAPEIDLAGAGSILDALNPDELVETFPALDLTTKGPLGQQVRGGGVTPAQALLFCRFHAKKKCGILGVVWVHGTYDPATETVTCRWSCGRWL